MKYPKVGEQVRIKNEAGLRTVTKTLALGDVELEGGLVISANSLVTRYQKTIKTWIVQGWFGSGWEDVTAEELHTEGRRTVRGYRENDSHHSYRLIVRYEPNDLYQGGES